MLHDGTTGVIRHSSQSSSITAEVFEVYEVRLSLRQFTKGQAELKKQHTNQEQAMTSKAPIAPKTTLEAPSMYVNINEIAPPTSRAKGVKYDGIRVTTKPEKTTKGKKVLNKAQRTKQEILNEQQCTR